MPEVRRVIVAYDDRIAYESTLSAALESLFGRGATDSAGSGNAGGGQSTGGAGSQIDAMTADELILEANNAYERAVSAQRNGDWSTYGRELQNLSDYLTKLLPEDLTAPAEEVESEEAVDTISN
jgi:uncharacterized membrane protein (UPF0182 family)